MCQVSDDVMCVKVLGSTFEFTKHVSSCCNTPEIDPFFFCQSLVKFVGYKVLL